MKPAPFTYHAPSSLAEAAALLAEHENARPLAGGQSLVPMMNFRYAAPDHLVDLNGIDALQGIETGATISLGAMTRQRDIEFSTDLASRCPVLIEALRNVGHRQTRNRGTIGGSLCHLDPAAELPAMMMLHDARLTITSSAGNRDVAMTEFALGFMTTAVEPHELLSRIAFDAWPLEHGFAFEEYARRHGDFAIASSGILLTLTPRGAIDRLAIVIGGLAPVPLRLTDFEASAIGATPDEDFIKATCAAAAGVEATDDVHVSATYRQHLASVLSGRALRRALKRAQERSLQNA